VEGEVGVRGKEGGLVAHAEGDVLPSALPIRWRGGVGVVHLGGWEERGGDEPNQKSWKGG